MSVRLKLADAGEESSGAPLIDPSALIEPDKPTLPNLVAYRFAEGAEAWQIDLWEGIFAEIEAKAAIEFYAPDGEVNLVIDTAEPLPQPVLGIARAAPHEPRKIMISDTLDFAPWYKAVAEHELMHALGFGHVEDGTPSVMTETITPLSRGMTELDHASLQAHYPEPEAFEERREAARWAEFFATREAWRTGEAELAAAIDDAQAHAGGPDAFVFLEEYGLTL